MRVRVNTFELMIMVVKLFQANIYLFKVNNRNPGKSCEICSKLTIMTPERRH